MTKEELLFRTAKIKDADDLLNVAASVDLRKDRLELGDIDREVGFLRTLWSQQDKKNLLVEVFKREIRTNCVLIVQREDTTIGFLIYSESSEYLSKETNRQLLANIVWFFGTRDIKGILARKKWVMLNRICVTRDSLRRGVGRRLVLYFTGLLKKRACLNLFSFVTVFPVRNEVSLRFHRKIGFKDVGEFSDEFEYSYLGKRVFIERLLHYGLTE